MNFYLTLLNLSHSFLICGVMVFKWPVLFLPCPLLCQKTTEIHEDTQYPGVSCFSLLLVALRIRDGLEHVWEFVF